MSSTTKAPWKFFANNGKERRIWFTADQHHGHANIIEYCNRPFNDFVEMDTQLIRRYNSIVQKEDLCYFIGDFSLRAARHRYYYEDLLRRYNGTKVLIAGNHDPCKIHTYVEMGFRSIHSSFETVIDDVDVVMAHDPAISVIDRSVLFLCGHVHDLFVTQKNAINVGVDIWNYFPVSWDQIKMILEDKMIAPMNAKPYKGEVILNGV